MQVLCNKQLCKAIGLLVESKHKLTLKGFCGNNILKTSFSKKDIDIIDPSGVISKSHTRLSEG